MTKAQLKTALMVQLMARPWIVWDGKGSGKALPDIMALRKGQVLGIRILDADEQLTAAEEEWRHGALMRGAIYIIVRRLSDVVQAESGADSL